TCTAESARVGIDPRRAPLTAPSVPRRRLPLPHRTTHGGRTMSVAYTIADSRVMITRSLRHTIRNVDVMLTAVMLPVVLMLLFVYVFGGAMNTGTPDYVDYVVPGIILLCAGFGAGSTA